MKNKSVSIAIAAAVLPHLFCCVLPIVLSIVGLIAPEFSHTHLIPHWVEPWIFVASAGILGLSWVMVVRDCHCHCDHCHAGTAHRTQKIVLSVVTVLFIISVILHLIAHE